MRRSLKMEHIRQDAHVAKMHAVRHPCPHCGELTSFAEAGSSDGDEAVCPSCLREMRYAVYLFGGQGFEKQ